MTSSPGRPLPEGWMKRTVAVVSVLCLVVSLGLGYVVGRSAGGDSGDSISSRLRQASPPSGTGTPAPPPTGREAPAGSTFTGAPVPATPLASTPGPATPERPGPATPMAQAAPSAATSSGSLTEADDLEAEGSPGSADATPTSATPVTVVPSTTSSPLPGSPPGQASQRPTPRPASDGDGIPVVFETVTPDP